MPDIHNHSIFSPDSNAKMEDMIDSAIARGLQYFAITEHYDFDAEELTDVCAFVQRAKLLKRRYKNKIHFAYGLEFGFSDSFDNDKLLHVANSYPLDFIINSVHRDALINLRKIDKGLSVPIAYERYCKAILKSLDAPYPYEVIGHFGYITRYCTRCPSILYEDYPELIDEILNKIIKKDKTLELNSAIGGGNGLFIPHESILKRYLELNGKNLSFGSDAHQPPVARKYNETIQFIKSYGIQYLDFFINHERIKVKI